MKKVVALLVLLMGASAIAEGAPLYEELVDKVDPMSGIYLQDEFTLRFLPASSTGDLPALRELLEEKERALLEEGETAMLLYQIGLLRFFLGDRYVAHELAEEDILHHVDEAVRVLERAMELGLEERYLSFAHGYIGSAIGTRAVYAGILESLALLGGLDRNITTAMRLGREHYGPTTFLSFVYMVRGRRFRDTPWFVGGSASRAMEYFRKAVEFDPGFILNYGDIALTYEEMGKDNEAIEYWQKVIDLPLHERILQWSRGSKESAEKALERLRGS